VPPVAAPSRIIPSTNRDLALYAIGGFVLVLVGGLLIFVSARRKRPYDR
jgi:LPXTG-motif cell wall-anchored protein